MNKINENHPDKTLLMSYIESPESEDVKNVRRHLISCVSCRELLATVQSMIGTLKDRPLTGAKVTGDDHLDEESIAGYVDGRVNAARNNQIKSHIDACGLCTKRALHYALYSTELRRAMSEVSISEEALDTNKPKAEYNPPTPPLRKGGIWQRIFSWRMPVWFGVPATALATAVLVFVLVSQERHRVEQPAQTAQQEKTKIILAYQENPEITISPLKGKTPGIGFFSQSRGETRRFGGLTVQRVSGMNYRVSWSPIEGVVEYDIRVFTSGPVGERSLVAIAKGVQETSIIMDLSSLDSGENYTWDLDGYMKDGRRFMTSGGFVVATYP